MIYNTPHRKLNLFYQNIFYFLRQKKRSVWTTLNNYHHILLCMGLHRLVLWVYGFGDVV
jgi:hypothetical protein